MSLMHRRVIAEVFFALSVATFAICLTCAAFYYDEYRSASVEGRSIVAMSAFGSLILGWTGLFSLETFVGAFPWLANPALLVAWIAFVFQARRVALVFSAASLPLALSFLLTSSFAITSIGLGYWLWLVSMACASGGAWLMQPKPKQKIG